jgi:hypothetical protein
MFLDMFEDEYRQMQMNPIRLEYLLKDACMLYPPTTTPLSGVEFIKRLPSGDIERARRVRKSHCGNNVTANFDAFSPFECFSLFARYPWS